MRMKRIEIMIGNSIALVRCTGGVMVVTFSTTPDVVIGPANFFKGLYIPKINQIVARIKRTPAIFRNCFARKASVLRKFELADLASV